MTRKPSKKSKAGAKPKAAAKPTSRSRRHEQAPRSELLDQLLALAPSVTGVSLVRVHDSALEIRCDDGVTVTLAVQQDEHDVPTVVVRGARPGPPEARSLSALNAAATLLVASGARDNAITQTIVRARMIDTIPPVQLLAALARDLGLAASLAAAPNASLDELRAMLAGASDYELAGDCLRGPSSLAWLGISRAVSVEIRMDDLGLVQVSHTAAPRPGDDAHAIAAAISELTSDDERCVDYARAYATTDGNVAVAVTTFVGELGTRQFDQKIRSLENAVTVYLGPREEPSATPIGDLLDLFTRR